MSNPNWKNKNDTHVRMKLPDDERDYPMTLGEWHRVRDAEVQRHKEK
jgi:hypothetical protein